MELRTRRELILAGAGLGLLLFGPGAFQWVRLAVQEWRLERQLDRLAGRKAALEAEVGRLTQDPVYVEGLIRSTFKWSKPGEYVIPLRETSGSSDSR